GDERRLDRLAEADLVGEQEPRARTVDDCERGLELIRDQIDRRGSGGGQAAGGRLAGENSATHTAPCARADHPRSPASFHRLPPGEGRGDASDRAIVAPRRPAPRGPPT